MPNFVESIQAQRIRVELNITNQKSEEKNSRRRKEKHKRQGSEKFSHAIFRTVRNILIVQNFAKIFSLVFVPFDI